MPGAVVLSSWLRQEGISAALAATYVRSGWLVPLGRGAWQVGHVTSEWSDAIHALQTQGGIDVQPYGLTALSLSGKLPMGVISPLSGGLYLSWPKGVAVPAWLTGRGWGRPLYVITRSEANGSGVGEGNVPVRSGRLAIPSPERALMELADQCSSAEDMVLLRHCLQGLVPLGINHLQQLIESWPVLRTRRVIVWLLEMTRPDMAARLQLDHINLGAGKFQVAGGGNYYPALKLSVPDTVLEDDTPEAKAATWLRAADKLLVTAGQGMRSDADQLNYFKPESFEAFYPAFARQGLTIDDLTSADFMSHEPRLAWAFYGDRLVRAVQKVPRSAFHLLRDAQRRFREGMFIFTTNVDGQFLRSHFPGNRVFEYLGSLHYWQCQVNCRKSVWPAKSDEILVDRESAELVSELPLCPYCGGLARPNVMLQGDVHFAESRWLAQQANYKDWKERQGRLIVMELGAGTNPPGCRSEGRATGAPIIRVNKGLYEVAGEGVGIAMHADSAVELFFGPHVIP